jgi:hypothetical protein
MKTLMKKIGLSKDEKKETDFAKFFKSAPSGERKKVFLKVAKKATNDQRKIMGYTTVGN